MDGASLAPGAGKRGRGARPALQKRLGQHHLVNPGVVRPLLAFLEPLAGTRVVEVGPGGGLLTRELLAAEARVWGIEVDPRWAIALRRSQESQPAAAAAGTLQLLAMDALLFAWERLPPPTLVAGNLPYNVATPLIASVLSHWSRVPRAAFLVQKEVADRLTARPGTRAYGALTVLVQCHAEARILGRVRPGSFRPPPKVESAFVGLVLRRPPLEEPELSDFLALVRLGFGQKRKTLRNSLGRVLTTARVEAALAELKLPAAARAEELSLERWLPLWRFLRSPMQKC